MLGTSFELVLLMVIAALAGVAALFAALCFFRMRPQGSALTEQTAGRILRSETDIVRGAVEDQARGLRTSVTSTFIHLTARILRCCFCRPRAFLPR
jgi:hypothetical protein